MKLLRKIFLDNLLEKFLALTLAISLAVTKRVDRVIRVKKMVSLELSYPDSRVMTSALPQQIELVIEGPYQKIQNLEEDRDQQIKPYRIQFDGSENGIYNFQRDYYALPPGLKLEAISPSSMVVQFDEKVERRVPVKPRFVDKMPDGYRLTETSVSPDFVTLVGAKSVVSKYEGIETRIISLADLKEGRSVEVGLRSPPLFTRFSIDAPRVNLSLKVEEIVDEITVEDRLITLKGFKELSNQTISVTPEQVTVTLKGPRSVLKGLTDDDVNPFVQIEGPLTKEVNVVLVKLEEIEGLQSWAVNPNRVSLVVKKVPISNAKSTDGVDDIPAVEGRGVR